MPEPAMVISNTSPLLYLYRIGELDLLKRMYDRISVARQVVEELAAGVDNVLPVESYDWVEIHDVSIPSTLKMVPDLGSGEAGTIALALESRQSVLLLIDDRLARQIVALHHLRCSGTAGVLMKGKDRGYVAAVRPLLHKVIQAGFYLRQQHMDDICEIVGE